MKLIPERKTGPSFPLADNGNGFDKYNIRPGNGLRYIETRAKDMNASLAIFSETGKGTRVLLKVPIT